MASLVHSGHSVNLPIVAGNKLSPRLGGPISRSSSTTSEHDYGKRNQCSSSSAVKSAGSNGSNGTNSPTPPGSANAATPPSSSASTAEQPMYTCKLNSSFTASTQFVSSLTTQNLDDVEQVLADYPEAMVENVAVEKQESPSKPNVVTQVVVIHPEDNEDEVVESAIRSITESLNRSAAEKIAKGESPPSETVIEIVRVKQPSVASSTNANSSGYAMRDGGYVQDKQVFIHSPSKGGTLEQQQRAGRLGSPPVLGDDEDNRGAKGHSPRASTPSPPRYSAMVRRKPDMSATCYFDTQQQQSAVAGRKLLQRSVSYTVTKTAPQNTNMKMAPQILQRRHLEGSAQGYKQAYVPQQMPSLGRTKNVASEEMDDQQFAVDDADDDDGESAMSMDRLSSSSYGSSGMGYHDDSDASRRPAYSYMHLIQMAICSKADRRMTLREIYQWIEDQFPYYRHQINKGWKNSIRHNLSLYDIFVREKNKSPNHTGSSYWTVRPNAKQKHGGLRSLNRFGDDNLNGAQYNLVKPQLAATTAYALIPIQNGLSAVSSKPYIVQPLADSGLISGDTGSYDKRPRILKRTIRSVSPCYQKQPRVVLKPTDPNLGQHNNGDSLSTMATRNSYPPLSRSAASRQLHHQQFQQHGDHLLSISLNEGMLEGSLVEDPYAQLDTSVTSDLHRMSLMNVRSVAAVDVVDSNDTSSSNFDGSANEDVLDTTTAIDVSVTSGDYSVVAKPKAYRSRKSKLLPRNCDLEDDGRLMSRAVTPERLSRATTPPLDVTPGKRKGVGNRSGEELFDADDIPELLSSLGHDFATPLKMLLSTPPKTSGDSFLSSTPISTLGDLPSPLGASLLCGFTPLSAGKYSSSPRGNGAYDLNIDSGIFGSTGITPFKLCEQSPPPYATRLRERLPSGDIIFAGWSPQAKGSTPLKHFSSPNSRSSAAALAGVLGSPGIGSLRHLGLLGLTPQRARRCSADDAVSPNDKHIHGGGKLLDGTPMEGEDIADEYLELVSVGMWPGSCKKVD